MVLRLLHTSDVHLERAFGYLGERANAHRERVKRAFERVYQLAQEHHCDALLIAGDLFDNPRVERNWVEFTLNLISSVRFPTLLIPGNHDPAKHHPFRDRSALPTQLRFYPSAGRDSLPALDLEVIACPAGEESAWQPLLSRTPNGAPFQIALIHGSMPSAGEGTIRREWLRDSQLDYIALGDWHSPQDFSEVGVPCWYSGAPEMIMPNQKLPAVALLVELEAHQPARITPLRTGEAQYPSQADGAGVLEISVAEHDSPHSLLNAIRPLLEASTVARIRLIGRWQAETPLEVSTLTEFLQSYCLWLEIDPAFQTAPLEPRTPFEHVLAQVYQERKADGTIDPTLLETAYQQALYLLRGGRL